MSISPQQAAEALHDIAQTETRSRELKGYEKGSPYLLLWGAIWAAGYVTTGLAPESASGWFWLVLDAIGFGGTAFLTIAQMRSVKADPGVRAARRRFGRKYAMGVVVVVTFWVADYLILKPHAINQYLAFPAILMGAIYALVGIVWLPRYLVLGTAISLLTLVGYFSLPEFFAFWMAAVGGGGLMLGGLWLRRV